jgi:transposase
MCDSWQVGCRETDHADADERGGLDDCAGGVRGVALAARRQGGRRPQVSRGAALLLCSQHHLAGAAGAVRALEQRLEAVLAPEPGGGVRGHVRSARGDERDGPSRADVRLHGGARARVGGGRKRGQQDQALGRSRGGFSTKIHLKADFDGGPLAFHLTGGEAGDSRHFETLLDIGPDITPRAALGDKGYDAKANRKAARARGICPAIPYKVTAVNRPAFFPKILYRGRARIEQMVGRLKRFKRIALRCEKTAQHYGSFVALALTLIIAKSVHTA